MPYQRPLAVAGQRVAVNICYEDVFGEEIIRQLPEATLLANFTNDAWWGDSLGLRAAPADLADARAGNRALHAARNQHRRDGHHRRARTTSSAAYPSSSRSARRPGAGAHRQHALRVLGQLGRSLRCWQSTLAGCRSLTKRFVACAARRLEKPSRIRVPSIPSGVARCITTASDELPGS